jgi:1-acyl-sn-glycerol-3-phosphate acyltransferase
MNPIHKFDFWHSVLRNYVDFYLYTFYDKVTIAGKNKIPKDKPVIFTINHQNALMDALTVLCTLKGQPVFMARADIFQSKIVAKILRFFKILPIYRIRDGIKSLQNNDAVFEEAVGVLEAGKYLVILPEGSHFGERRLRALKKGIARIAFQAEERNNFELDIQIIPIGLDYSHYINFGADLLVNFGDPFPISKYKDLYLENNQKGMNTFLQELREHMINQMLHVNDTENYNEIETLKDIYINHLLAKRKLRNNHVKIIEKSQEIVDNAVELKKTNLDKFKEIGKQALDIKDLLRDLKLRYWTVAQKRYFWMGIILNYLLLAILSPLFIYGFVVNILPFYLPVIASHKIKDPQFVSSIRFGVSLITFTLFYLIYLILLLIYMETWYWTLSVLITFLLSGIFSFRYYVAFKKNIAKTKINIWKLTKNKKWKELKNKWDNVVSEMEHIVKN